MMILLLVGISYVLYVVSNAIAMVVEGKLSNLMGRRSMERKIAKLEGHILICGVGRVGIRGNPPLTTRSGAMRGY